MAVTRRLVAAIVLGLLAAALAACPRASAATPLAGVSLWADEVGTPQALAAQARAAGAGTVIVKAAEGTTAEGQFSPALVEELAGQGLRVCAWVFAYGVEPRGEADAAIAAVRDGATCLVVDAEDQYDGRYGSAQLYVRTLRVALGASFPIALAGQAEVLEHPTFPYSVFLGPGAFDVDMPQVYWLELGLSVPASLRAALGQNAVYGRPTVPLGQLFDGPPPAELEAFSGLSERYGCLGRSFFDADAAQPAQLAALAARAAGARAGRLRAQPPVIRPGADGDEIVWAQELLDAAGAHLPVGGFFGASTDRALEAFQRSHRLRVDGLLDAPTWRALLRLRAREPSWTKAPPDSAA